MISASHFRNVPDWPAPGIQFKDLSPILRDADLLAEATAGLIEASQSLAGAVDFVIAPEARGFLFGPALATALEAGFIPARKPGKLPPETRSVSYELEYGHDHLHIPDESLQGATILIHDDLLATGGTAAAIARLLDDAGARIAGAVFLSELTSLEGRSAIDGIPVRSLVRFD